MVRVTNRMLALTRVYGVPRVYDWARPHFGRTTMLTGEGVWRPFIENFGRSLRN